MKLTVMKLVCLLALLGGIFILGLIFDIDQARTAYDRVISLWPKLADGSLNLRLPGSIAGAVLVLLGGYGFLPRLSSKKEKVITYRGAHGDIALQLKPIRKVLLKVMRKMPEVYSMKLAVKPDADGRRACITADVVLRNSAALGARRCARMVADCLTATARDVLGLEDLSAVRVNIKGVHLNVGAAGRQMRELVTSRAEEEESAAYALAHPPVASVTLDEDSTDNRSAMLREGANAATLEEAAGESQAETVTVPGEEADSTRNIAIAAATATACESCTDELTADEAENLFEAPEEAEQAEEKGPEVEITLPPLLDTEEAAPALQEAWETPEVQRAEELPDAAPAEAEPGPEESAPPADEGNAKKRWW